MKKLLFTALLGASLIIPATFTATINNTISKTELSSKKQKKKAKKSKSRKSSASNRSGSYYYSQSGGGCTYGGNKLYVGSRGGCYYYSGSTKQYVDRSYCSGCN